MKNKLAWSLRAGLLLVLLFLPQIGPAGELYIITTDDGSQIIVKDYTFEDEYVRFITPNDLPGFIKRDRFAGISNMVGEAPGQEMAAQPSVEEERKREMLIWVIAAVVLVTAYILFVLLVTGRKKKQHKDSEGADVYYTRTEREPTTQGHLSFRYRGAFGREHDWVVDVRRAYEEDGVLIFEGISTTTEKRKTFHADQVVGKVTDMSSGHSASIEHFFADPASGRTQQREYTLTGTGSTR